MPTYTFKNKDTGEEWDEIISIASRDKLLEDNPNYEQVIKPIGVRDNFISGVGLKPSNEFRSMLKNMKAANPGSTIDTF